MGCFPSRKNRRLGPASNPPPPTWIFKARAGSQQMLVYDISFGSIKEVGISCDSPFQPGQSLCLWAAGILFLVGGQDDGLLALKIDMSLGSASRILSPPYPLAYGYLHRYADRMYLAGAVTHSRTGQMDIPAQVMTFNPIVSKWEALPAVPGSVALSGSFLLSDSLYLLGGFTDFPNKPRPFDKVLRYTIKESNWSYLVIESPVRNALPSCVVLLDQSVLIIGGFDPTEELEESFNVFRFQHGAFTPQSHLPDLGERRFTDSPYLCAGKVYLISEDETLFTFDPVSNEWTGTDLVEKLRKNLTEDNRMVRPLRSAAAFVYHYLDSECAWIEFSLDTNDVRKIEPLSFRSYVKHPGLLLLDDGCILVAGGLKQTRDSREAVDSVWSLDPVSKLTADLMNLPKKQYGLKLVCLANDVYAIAGVTDSGSGGRCQAFSLSAKEWRPLPEMMYPTQFPGVCLFRSVIYAICGCSEVAEGASAYNLIQVFSPETGAWDIRRTEYPQGVKLLALCPLNDGSLLCVGGLYATNEPCFAAYLFDDAGFVQTGSLPERSGGKGVTHFRDPVARKGDQVYLCSLSGCGYVYDVRTRSWSCREMLISNRM